LAQVDLLEPRSLPPLAAMAFALVSLHLVFAAIFALVPFVSSVDGNAAGANGTRNETDSIVSAAIGAQDETGQGVSYSEAARLASAVNDTNGTNTSARLPLCDLGPEQPVAIGDQMPICFFLSTNPPKKMVFRVQVEQYAELVLKGSQAKAIANDRMPIYTWAAVTGSNASLPLDCSKSDDIEQRSHLVSCPQVYATSTRMAHMLNLVVNLRDGKLSSFAWDNGCAGCGPDACIESKKSIDIHTGAESGGLLGSACGAEVTGCTSNDVGCDMKVFVTWAGTDKDGRHATSAGMRMSKFTGYTLTSLYEKANQNYKKVVG